ncbi:MAG: hypothetical protein E7612_03530 [Ruminococcaceae bacterium]|nr:hypothetical protein [Oscillospiraceae bacterium]
MVYNIIFDVLLVGAIVAGAVLGIKRGFFYTAAKPIKWFAAFILAITLSSSVASGIVQPIIEEPITNHISDFLIEKCEDLAPEDAKEELPMLLKIAAALVDVDIDSIDGESTSEFIVQTVDKLAKPAIYLIAVIISFFAVYFLSKLFLAIALNILNGFFIKGVLGIFNRILGCILGAFFAFIMVWLFVVLFGYIINIPAIAQTQFGSEFTGGHVYKFIKSMSPLDLLLSF